MYNRFKESAEQAASKFKDISKKEAIRVISHLDADGISAASILIKMLTLENRKYTLSIVQQVDEALCAGLARESFRHYVFTDLGSGQLSLIAKHLSEKNVFILDHHEPEKGAYENITHLNPHLFGIDGSEEISGAGVVYFFAVCINKAIEDLAHIAVIGAIGDIQEKQGFRKLNNEILEMAVARNKICASKGLRMFGTQTKYLYKLLEYSTDIIIPGVTGSESGAVQFLCSLGIQPKINGHWRRYIDLSEDEKQRLITGIVMKRVHEKNPEDIIGNNYILTDEEKGCPFRDAKEFSTLLNSCGRLNRSSSGIGACLGDEKSKATALKILKDYKKEIVNAIKWYNEYKKSKGFIKSSRYIVINAEDKVLSSIIGTLASIISKSNEYEEGTFILSMAQNREDDTTKVSLRIAGSNNNEHDLQEIMKEIIQICGGNAGGHFMAAGGIIKTVDEPDFIKAAIGILDDRSIEERIKS